MTQKQTENLIKKAHDKITRIKGREYSPTALEIQNEINKSLTAVEWLIKEIKNFDSGRSQYYNKAAIYDHAYRMEKEQITEAHLQGLFADHKMRGEAQAEQYYNEKYGK